MSRFSPVIVHVARISWGQVFSERLHICLPVIIPPVFHTYILSGARTLSQFEVITDGYNLTAFVQLEENYHIPYHFIHFKFKTRISSYILNLTIRLHSTTCFHIFNNVHKIAGCDWIGYANHKSDNQRVVTCLDFSLLLAVFYLYANGSVENWSRIPYNY
jgi:hypothetical protein